MCLPSSMLPVSRASAQAWADATAGSRKPMFISCIKMTTRVPESAHTRRRTEEDTAAARCADWSVFVLPLVAYSPYRLQHLPCPGHAQLGADVFNVLGDGGVIRCTVITEHSFVNLFLEKVCPAWRASSSQMAYSDFVRCKGIPSTPASLAERSSVTPPRVILWDGVRFCRRRGGNPCTQLGHAERLGQ